MPFLLPHSTNVFPTASSVTVFQLALNQTLKTPGVATLGACWVGWAAARPPAAERPVRPAGPARRSGPERRAGCKPPPAGAKRHPSQRRVESESIAESAHYHPKGRPCRPPLLTGASQRSDGRTACRDQV